jgi:hypothetical protein
VQGDTRVSGSLRQRKTSRKVKGECLIPPRVPHAAINQFAFKREDAEGRSVAEYVESRHFNGLRIDKPVV